MACGAGAPSKMANAGLTGRVALSGFAKTLQQRVSVTSSEIGQLLHAGFSKMPSPVASQASARTLFRRFRRNRQGSAVVEFALVAPVFFALLFAIIETAIMFFADSVLETVTQNSARQILTGQAQTANYPDATHFRNAVVCSQIPAIFNCLNISVDVKSYSSFSNVNISLPIVGGNFDTTSLGYSPGNSCDIVVARLFYQWPLFVTGLGYNISNLSGNQRLLMATAAFRNEPYAGACPA
jgi:Flp pilus assembly protein TadG